MPSALEKKRQRRRSADLGQNGGALVRTETSGSVKPRRRGEPIARMAAEPTNMQQNVPKEKRSAAVLIKSKEDTMAVKLAVQYSKEKYRQEQEDEQRQIRVQQRIKKRQQLMQQNDQEQEQDQDQEPESDEDQRQKRSSKVTKQLAVEPPQASPPLIKKRANPLSDRAMRAMETTGANEPVRKKSSEEQDNSLESERMKNKDMLQNDPDILQKVRMTLQAIQSSESANHSKERKSRSPGALQVNPNRLTYESDSRKDEFDVSSHHDDSEERESTLLAIKDDLQATREVSCLCPNLTRP